MLKKIIILFMLTITFVAQANADSAWIKWEHETSITKKDKKLVKTVDNWYLQEAFPSYGLCMNSIRATANGFCSGFFGNIYPKCTVTDTSVTAISESENHYIEFMCYPETIDPRK